MGIPVIEISDVSKRFTIRREKALKDTLLFRKRGIETLTVVQAVDQVSLSLDAGSTVGLMGHNGSGKSTLLKLIGGILEPDSGRITRRGRLAALLELGAGFHPDLTGRENVFLNAALLGIDRKTAQSRFEEIVDFSGVADFIDTPVKFYSSGMYVRLAFSVAVNVYTDILLGD
jgi:ABC-2 type transport system ATP-binding protein